MRTVNVDRMRRYSEAAREAQRRRERLAAMTPEHRARHQAGIPYGVCSDCLNMASREFGRIMALGLESMRKTTTRT